VGALGDRALGTLSGGERQRVALAGLLAQAAPILLVDEPPITSTPRSKSISIGCSASCGERAPASSASPTT